MTREEALKKLNEKSFNEETISQDIEFICNKLEITKSEMYDLLRAPKKTYKDYKNYLFIYSLGSWILRILGVQFGGKR